MNLELVEQLCFLILTESENPLVPIDVLLAHLREEPACEAITNQELLQFLRDHTMFKVVEPLAIPATAAMADQFTEAGVSTTPRVILASRVPTPPALLAQMYEELTVLANALNSALADSERRGAPKEVEQAQSLLLRVEAFREKLRQADEGRLRL
jgi:hypothetical protein